MIECISNLRRSTKRSLGERRQTYNCHATHKASHPGRTIPYKLPVYLLLTRRSLRNALCFCEDLKYTPIILSIAFLMFGGPVFHTHVQPPLWPLADTWKDLKE